eukprot:gnl/MRDRNA2_/MRDRNA2_67490_c0_seq1.p1 gnl/MRDRNA2_/MRDRNA2_67490_c0~~gnl/MRDRNA2_/MRDRNA2_67490_c0_seq1.p1  ORF type:complete len:238 (+),score=50.22 gnl/MRDRNA2_/MRDRNA2_67490_c0_seq1:89-715(+)
MVEQSPGDAKHALARRRADYWEMHEREVQEERIRMGHLFQPMVRCDHCVSIVSQVQPDGYEVLPAGVNKDDKVYSDRDYRFLEMNDFLGIPYVRAPVRDRALPPDVVQLTMRAEQDVDVLMIFYCVGDGNSHREKRPWVENEGWTILKSFEAPSTSLLQSPDEIRFKNFKQGSSITIKGFNARSGKELNAPPWIFVRPSGPRKNLHAD